jgi:phytoene dehydrogenase-like protein
MYDVAIIGGGIGGLACAQGLRQAGLKPIVIERRPTLGGRAAVQSVEGFDLDQGPHALYRKGPGMAVLRRLGVRIEGKRPPVAGQCYLQNGDTALPASLSGLLRFSPASAADRFALARITAGLGRIDARQWDDRPLQAWLDTQRPVVAQVLAMFARLTTYAHAPAQQSAGAVIRAMQLGAGGVLYLNRGWQSLIDALAEGVDHHVARATAVTGDVGARQVQTGAGVIEARAVVVAGSPAVARRLLGVQWQGTPVRTASLTLALDRPPPVRFGLGYAEPMYISVPSMTAQQAPEGAAVVHVLRYLRPGEAPPDVDVLEGFLDRIDPGWRAAERHRRWLPGMIVSHHLSLASTGGPAGRADGQIAPDLHVVGDWVGPVGQLADASLASADTATQALIERFVERAA